MSWHSGEEFSCDAINPANAAGTASGHVHPQFGWHGYANGACAGYSGAGNEATTSQDIQLLNDDQEKAILRDLCKTGGGPESTPLTTFSYISEYICSNNIDIWPGEFPPSSGTSDRLCLLEPKNGEQRLPTSSCIHNQVYLRCKRVLESIIAKNEQILALLRQRQHPDRRGASKRT